MRAVLLLQLHVSQSPSPHTSREVPKVRFKKYRYRTWNWILGVGTIKILILILSLDKLSESEFSHLQHQYNTFYGKGRLGQVEDPEVLPLPREREFSGTCQFQSRPVFAGGWGRRALTCLHIGEAIFLFSFTPDQILVLLPQWPRTLSPALLWWDGCACGLRVKKHLRTNTLFQIARITILSIIQYLFTIFPWALVYLKILMETQLGQSKIWILLVLSYINCVCEWVFRFSSFALVIQL